MTIRTTTLGLSAFVFLCFMPNKSYAFEEPEEVILYTQNTSVSVPPGQSVSYSVDLINNSKEVVDAELLQKGLPPTWKATMRSGEYIIRQIAVLPGERKTFNLSVEVPLKVNKGNYRFQIIAGNVAVMPLTINISEQGTFKTEFTIKQANMQGKANATYNFQASLKNLTADKQLYALMADGPRGWNVVFKNNYQQVSSVEIEPNSTADLAIEVDPPDMIAAGIYKIPVRATSRATSLEIGLEVEITGSYAIQLSTPTGLLSTDITADDQKRIELIIRNTGSSELQGIELNAGAPVNWEVVFDPRKIDKLEPGTTTKAFAIIKAAKTAIAGDYVTNLEAKTPETSSQASFRISVKTPLIWGWMGIFVIILALGSVIYLFRRYGRR